MTTQSSHLRSVVAGGLGNILEWYDFSLYAYLAPLLATLFFPEEDSVTAIILVFTVFAAGFIVRPIGGIFFGYIGDRVGRSRALQLTVLLMSIPTFLTAFLPTFAMAGKAAPILFVLTRLLQGLCVGGEAAGSVIYLGEIASKQRRGLITSLTNSGSNIGVLMASGLSAFVFGQLSSADMALWGWRILYFIGGILGLVFLIYRRNLQETPVFKALMQQKTLAETTMPIKAVMQTAKWPMFRVSLFVSMGASLFYIGYVYLPTYLHEYAGLPMSKTLWLVTLYNFLSLLFIPFFGWLSDCFSRRLLIGVAVLVIMLSMVCFHLMLSQVWLPIMIGSMVLTMLSNMEQGMMPANLVETFPRHNRYTGLALGYNIAYSLLGGMAPMLVGKLIQCTKNPISPAYYIMVMALITGTTLYFSLQYKKNT